MSIQKGQVAEDQAKAYLIAQGLTWVASRYRSRFGEVDLIMQQQDLLIFVEVKSRTSTDFAMAFESVTPAKQRKLWVTASQYLSEKKLHDRVSVRFDVLALHGQPPKVQWIQDAFRRGV